MTCHAHIQAATRDYHRKYLWDGSKTASLTCNTVTTMQTQKEHNAVILVAHLQHRYTNIECRMQRCSRESSLNRYQRKSNPSCPAPSLHACSSFAAGLQRRPQILDKVQNTSWHKHDITLESVVFLSTKAEHNELDQISIDKMMRTR